MAALTTVEAVRRRGSLSDNTEVNVKVAEALSLTTARLGDALRTDFDRVVGTYDEFYVSRYKLRTQPRRIKLLLNHGFVDSGQSTEVRVSSDLVELANQTPIEATNLRWDYGRGVVQIVGSDQLETILNRWDVFGDLYVRVDYTAGFTTESESASGVETFVYLQSEVPAWLIETATQWGYVTYDWLRSDKRTGRGPTESADFKDRIEGSVVARNMRYVPTAVRAIA